MNFLFKLFYLNLIQFINCLPYLMVVNDHNYPKLESPQSSYYYSNSNSNEDDGKYFNPILDKQANRLLNYQTIIENRKRNRNDNNLQIQNNFNRIISLSTNKPYYLQQPAQQSPQQLPQKSTSTTTTATVKAITERVQNNNTEIERLQKLKIEVEYFMQTKNKSSNQIECIKCSELPDTVWCTLVQDYELYKMINKYCCQCITNSDSFTTSTLSSTPTSPSTLTTNDAQFEHNQMKKLYSKQFNDNNNKSLSSTSFILMIVLAAVLLSLILTLFLIFICCLKNNNIKNKETNNDKNKSKNKKSRNKEFEIKTRQLTSSSNEKSTLNNNKNRINSNRRLFNNDLSSQNNSSIDEVVIDDYDNSHNLSFESHQSSASTIPFQSKLNENKAMNLQNKKNELKLVKSVPITTTSPKIQDNNYHFNCKISPEYNQNPIKILKNKRKLNNIVTNPCFRNARPPSPTTNSSSTTTLNEKHLKKVIEQKTLFK
jgi:hypothetical protein